MTDVAGAGLTRTRAHVAWGRGDGVGADARMVIFAALIASSVLFPNFALRWGAYGMAVITCFALIRRPRLMKVDALVLAYAILTALSLGWTRTLSETLNTSANTLACAAIFIGIRVGATRARDYFFYTAALAAAVSVQVILLVSQEGGGARLLFDSKAPRLGLEGINLNYSAYAFATVTAVFFGVVLVPRLRHRRLAAAAFIAFFILSYVGIVLNGTRGALVGLLAIPVWGLLARGHTLTSSRVLSIGALTASVAVALGLFDRMLGQGVSSGIRDTGDLNGRLSAWPVAREYFLQAPLVGHGAGSFQGLPMHAYGVAAHTYLLDVAVGLGLAGVLVLLSVFLQALWPMVRANQDRNAAVAMGAFVISQVPILLSGYWLESPVFWAGLALTSLVPAVVSAMTESNTNLVLIDPPAESGSFPPGSGGAGFQHEG